MDFDDEAKKFKAILILSAYFLIATFFAYRELKYTLVGETGEARVTKVYEVSGRRGATRYIDYRFTDKAGNVRTDSITISPDDSILQDQTISIEYLSGVSRRQGTRNVVALVAFFVGLVAIGVMGYFLWRAERESRPKKRPAAKPW